MANTTHGLPYPVGTDRVMDGDNVIRSLAEALDPAVINPGVVAAAGWTIGNQALLVRGPQMDLNLWNITRTGATLTMGSDGNSADTALATGLPAQYCPIDTAFGQLFRGGSNTYEVFLAPSGTITQYGGQPTATITSGLANLRLRISWLLHFH